MFTLPTQPLFEVPGNSELAEGIRAGIDARVPGTVLVGPQFDLQTPLGLGTTFQLENRFASFWCAAVEVGQLVLFIVSAGGEDASRRLSQVVASLGVS